jgi:hypothetical protein
VGQVDQFQPFGEPASFTSAIERSNMEEGKIATAWAQFARKSIHVYKNATWSNTLLAWGRLGSISALVNQPVLL